jgi:hypothetical protein
MAYQKKGYPRSRPYMWVTGPDPRTHAQYRAWVQQRNQARWREEIWCLTFDQYQLLWAELWHLRGRLSTSYMMTRIDGDLPWSQANSIVITRQQHGQRQADRRSTGRRSPARERELAAVAEQSE